MNFQQNQPTNFKLPQSVTQATENLGTGITSLKSSVNNNFSQFSNQADAGVGASVQYLQSNTIVAKFVFLIVVIVAFLFLLNLGISLIQYFLTPASNIYIISGLVSGQMAKTFPQDPKVGSLSTLITRSNNQPRGIEFTWSVWLFINDIGTDKLKYQFIFNKGDTTLGANNISMVNNGPGLYLGPNIDNKATLRVIMNTSEAKDDNNFVDIENVPIRKWIHVAIRVENSVMDIYVNGVISGRISLPLVPKQNYNDVNICQGGGFNGNLSDLRYFSKALNVIEINNIYYFGPTLRPADDTLNAAFAANGNYISGQWYDSKMA